jgi:GDP-L-fucose synthase
MGPSMKVFITGGSGFIGRNLKEQLANKYRIFAPSSNELNLLDGDAVNDYLKKNKFDVVIHSATWNATKNSSKDTTRVLENNLRMFFNMTRGTSHYGKMLYFGSGAEYDRRNWIPRMKEEYFDIHVPADDYGFSKYIIAKYAANTIKIFNLRLFGVFGKYEDWEIRFISNACCKAAWDMPITIRQNVAFDYLYVDDLVKITEWFMSNDAKNNIYNVCTGMSFELESLAQKVLAASGKNLDIVIEKEGLGKEYSGDNDKLLKEMGGFIFRGMDDCVNDLYAWYLKNKMAYDPSKLLVDK